MKYVPFLTSAKRLSSLQEYVIAKYPESSHFRLKSFCATCWIQRHESINVFLEFLRAVATALQTMTETGNRETSQKAAPHLSTVGLFCRNLQMLFSV